MDSDRGTRDHRAAVAAALRGHAFEHSDTAQLLLGPDRRLVVANRRARELFRIADEDAGKSIQDLDVSDNPIELRSRIDEAEASGRAVLVNEVGWGQDGAQQLWDVTVAPLSDGESPQGTMVAFVEVTRYRGFDQELERTNEQLQSTNEELQSTNDELATMNDELQCTNDELASTNDELRMRSAELQRVNVLFEAVLRSLEMGVIVADPELRVQVWNRESENLWGLRSSEVLGRHLFRLDVGLPVDELSGPARACLNGTSRREALHLGATDRRGRSIGCNITMLPLAEGDDVRGVVILVESRPAEG